MGPYPRRLIVIGEIFAKLVIDENFVVKSENFALHHETDNTGMLEVVFLVKCNKLNVIATRNVFPSCHRARSEATIMSLFSEKKLNRG